MKIPEIVKEYVLKNCGRMPETQKEIDEYLDLINHANEYAKAALREQYVSRRMLKRLGIKTTDEIKEEGQKLFNPMTSLTPSQRLEEQKIAELMKPRFKVVADYPQNKYFQVGTIIDGFKKWPDEDGSYWQYTIEDCQGKHQWLSSHFNMFPHLFKELAWWEERNPEEMPEYVKFEGDKTIFCATWKLVPANGGLMTMHLRYNPEELQTAEWYVVKNVMAFYKPATSLEYKEYIKKQTV